MADAPGLAEGRGQSAAPPPALSVPDDLEQISIVELLTVLLRRRGLIVASALVTLAIVVGVTLAWPRSYTSESIFVPQQRKTPAGLTGLAAQLGVMLPNVDAGQSPAFYADLLGSRELLGAVVDTKYAYQSDGALVTRTLLDVYHPWGATAAIRRERAIKKLGDHIDAKAITRTGVVTVSVTTPSAELSQQVNQRLLDLLNEFNLQSRQSTAAAERRFTEQRLQEVQADLRQAEDRLQTFLQRNRDYRNSPELTFERDRLDREVTLKQTLFSQLTQAFEQSRIEEVRDTPVITIVEHPYLPVRPDTRYVLLKGLVALILGGLIGVGLALGREFFGRAQRADASTFAEFVALRRQLGRELLRPWLSFKRSRQGASSDGAGRAF
jgi:uncharacterized protein involved in exopolysaccharide biosynthesis